MKARMVAVAGLLVFMTLAASASTVQFNPTQTYSVGNPSWIVVGDFNNDGKRDIVVINKGDPTVNDPGGVPEPYTAIVSGRYHAFVGIAILVLAYLRKTRLEEQALLNNFGAAYDDYRRDTWALVPLLF